MDEGLDGKVAIVTGGGARDDGIGNGRAAALLLADAGARVLVVDRWMSAAQRTVEMITGNGGIAVAFDADVTVDTDCEAMVAKALALWRRLDVLDNNVGVGSRGSVVDESPTHWRRVMKINVESIFLASNTSTWLDRVQYLQKRNYWSYAGHGGRSWAGGHSSKLRRAGAGIYADGIPVRNERKSARRESTCFCLRN